MDGDKLVLFLRVLDALSQLTSHEAPLYAVIFLFTHQTLYEFIRSYFFFKKLVFVLLAPILLLKKFKVLWIATAVWMVLGLKLLLLSVAF